MSNEKKSIKKQTPDSEAVEKKALRERQLDIAKKTMALHADAKKLNIVLSY